MIEFTIFHTLFLQYKYKGISMTRHVHTNPFWSSCICILQIKCLLWKRLKYRLSSSLVFHVNKVQHLLLGDILTIESMKVLQPKHDVFTGPASIRIVKD